MVFLATWHYGAYSNPMLTTPLLLSGVFAMTFVLAFFSFIYII